MYKNKWLAFLLLVPMLAFMIMFLFYPFAVNIYNSFFSFESILDKNPIFIGIANYKLMFNDSIFIGSLVNTLILVGLVIIFQAGIALILALLVSSIKRFSSFFKVTYFMPIVVSATALGLMFNLFYDYEYGMFNQVLAIFGSGKVFWKDPANLVRLFSLIVAPVIWQYIGFYFVIFLTGLNGINQEIIEAAEIDGCSRFQKVIYVQLPMLQNVTRTVLVLSITGTLKVFDLPYLISPHGFPNGQTHFLGTYMYDKAFNSNDIGYAAAFAVFMVIAGVLMSMISNSILKQNKNL
ncbi:MAG: sugar ABC transporter permease [Bacilli bacterium]|nr:sugar ABC transporter permease [Bacilli bacterium]